MYYYKGFSLVIESELEFPEFVPIEYNPNTPIDLKVKIGKTPKELVGDDVLKKVRNWASPKEFLLNIIDVARIHLIGGHTATIEPLSANPEWNGIRTLFLSSIMSAVLHYKSMLPLHASGVCYEDGVVLFCGLSGAGKSTTSIFLKERGYPLFSDDICVIHPEHITNNQVLVHASYPMSRLWEDTIEVIGDQKYHKNHRVRAEIAKYGNFFHQSFNDQALPIKHIYHIVSRNDMTFEKEPIETKAQRMNILRNNTFRKRQLEGIQGEGNLFKMLTKMLHLPITTLYRPSGGAPISSFIDFIEHECLSRISANKI